MSITVEDVNYCDFSQWYSRFAKSTIKSVIIPLTHEFITYLLEDGLFMPSSHRVLDNISDSDEEYATNDDQPLRTRDFLELEATVNSVISELGGSVFIKCNWSAPTDASWINGGSMKCQTYHDILLLMKSSDRIVYDIEHIYDECIDKELMNISSNYNNRCLILRKWTTIHPSMEFRLFVKDSKLRGISQRDCSAYYSFLVEEKHEIAQVISDFFVSTIHGNFPSSSYTVDVFITNSKKVKIIDFNVFGRPTNSLLYDWDNDFQDSMGVILNNESYDIRIIERREQVHPSDAGQSRGPIDVPLAPDFYQFMEICRNQNRNTDDDETEESYEDPKTVF